MRKLKEKALPPRRVCLCGQCFWVWDELHLACCARCGSRRRRLARRPNSKVVK